MGKEQTHKLRRVANRLWKYRKIANLSQRQLSVLLAHRGTSQISKWEKGVKIPSLENALRLSLIFKISVEDLFSGVAAGLKNEISLREKTVNYSRQTS